MCSTGSIGNEGVLLQNNNIYIVPMFNLCCLVVRCTMTEEINKKKLRSIYCTEEDWEKIKDRANKARQSISQYLLSKGLCESEE